MDLTKAPVLDPADLPPPPPEGAEGERTGQAAEPPRAVARLAFLDPGSVSTVIPLVYPFAWEGREIREIVVRKLSVGEMGDVARDMMAREVDDMDEIYAAMIGLPPDVLRGMMEEDVEAVTTACAPFFAPLDAGVADWRDWRRIALVVARASGEAVTAVLAWPWDEALRFLVAAQEIAAEEEEIRAEALAALVGRA